MSSVKSKTSIPSFLRFYECRLSKCLLLGSVSENMKSSLYFVINHGKYRDSVGVIATRIRARRSGVRVPAGARDFTLLLNA